MPLPNPLHLHQSFFFWNQNKPFLLWLSFIVVKTHAFSHSQKSLALCFTVKIRILSFWLMLDWCLSCNSPFLFYLKKKKYSLSSFLSSCAFSFCILYIYIPFIHTEIIMSYKTFNSRSMSRLEHFHNWITKDKRVVEMYFKQHFHIKQYFHAMRR